MCVLFSQVLLDKFLLQNITRKTFKKVESGNYGGKSILLLILRSYVLPSK